MRVPGRQFLIALATMVMAGGEAVAEQRQVDVELVLAVDVSGSMRFNELRIQRRGYVDAFRSAAVHKAIENGLIGEVAVIYIEWARSNLQRVIVPWTPIASAADAHAFADRLEAAPLSNMRNTSISGAIHWGIIALDANDFDGMRRVIDISGDGPNNHGRRVDTVRDQALDAGIVINGLPIMAEPWMGGLGFNITGLDVYYRACVAGGPGSFVLPVHDWDEFAEAVRRKIVLELAGIDPAPVHLANDAAIDCTIGERLRGVPPLR